MVFVVLVIVLTLISFSILGADVSICFSEKLTCLFISLAFWVYKSISRYIPVAQCGNQYLVLDKKDRLHGNKERHQK